MSGGSLVATNNYAQTSSAVSISSPISYTSLSRNNSANFQDALANGLSPEAVIASSMAMPTNGSLFGSYYTNDFTSSVDAYNPGSYNGIGYSGIRDRQNLGPGAVEDTWLIWLWQHINQFGTQGEDGYYYDQNQLYDAWVAFCSSWNETMGKKPSWDEWLAWFMGDGGSHTLDNGNSTFNAHFVPVGNMLSLLILVLMYVAFLCCRSLKTNKE